MKIDVTPLRFLTEDEFRILTAIEMGMKNHTYVPLPLIESIAQLRHGGTHKFIANLLKFKLLQHETKHYDGYTLTYNGYDILALRSYLKKNMLFGLGPQIGVGKESDVFSALIVDVIEEIEDEEHADDHNHDFDDLSGGEDEDENYHNEEEKMRRLRMKQMARDEDFNQSENMHPMIAKLLAQGEKEVVIKFARLGRTSFRSIKNNRDYSNGKSVSNWLYYSRLAALKEFSFMKALYEVEEEVEIIDEKDPSKKPKKVMKKVFPVPMPVECNRHSIVMQRIKGYPLAQVQDIDVVSGTVVAELNAEEEEDNEEEDEEEKEEEVQSAKHFKTIGLTQEQQDQKKQIIWTMYKQSMDLIVKLAEHGLIHGDFNEFNLMLKDDASFNIVMIDFPQMVSTTHENAEFYFDRDVECIRRFFRRRFGMMFDLRPKLSEILASLAQETEVANPESQKKHEKVDLLSKILAKEKELEAEDSQEDEEEEEDDENAEEEEETEEVEGEEAEAEEEEQKPKQKDLDLAAREIRQRTRGQGREKKVLTEEEIKRKVKFGFEQKRSSKATKDNKKIAQKGKRKQMELFKKDIY